MSRIHCRFVAMIALTLLAMLSAAGQGYAQEKIQIEVCVLSDAKKLVNGIRVHIAPLGRADPPMQTTNMETCLRFVIDATSSFDVAFYNSEGEVIGVLRGMAGFESTPVRVNHKRLSLETKENALLRLSAINAYTKTLSTHKSVQAEVVELLRGQGFKRQIDTMSNKLGSTTPAAVRGEIFLNVDKMRIK